jgi:uncharacterized protein YjbI with pentapeptide repeats
MVDEIGGKNCSHKIRSSLCAEEEDHFLRCATSKATIMGRVIYKIRIHSKKRPWPFLNSLKSICFYATLRFSTLLHASRRYSTLRYSTQLYATLRYATLRYATLRYSTLLHASRRYSTLRYSTQLYATLRYATLRYSTLLYSTLLSLVLFYRWQAP